LLDKTYDSGMEDCPGTRFVVELKTSAGLGTMAEEAHEKSIHREDGAG
jgi:hypothetical protein